MAYIGNIPAEAYISLSSQTFTTINGTVYTLSTTVANSDDLALFLNNVRQKPSTYTATDTTLTMGTATTTADELYCVFLGKGIQTVNPPAGSVGTSQIADLAVTTAKLDNLAVTNAKVADDAVGLDELSATGTPSASNYLRGDNSWASVAADTNDKVGVSADDTTPGYLNGKLVAGANISLTEGSGGGDETLTAAFTGSLNASVLNAGTVATARLGSGTADGTTFLRGDQTYAAAGGGKILQVVQANKTDTWTSSANATWTDVTGLSVTTGSLASTSSKVLVMISICVAGTDTNGIKIVDGSSADIAGFIGDAAGSRIRSTTGNNYWANNYRVSPVTGICLDSPSSTDAQTYKIQMFVSSASVMRVNYANNDANSNVYFRGVSSITAMEIGA